MAGKEPVHYFDFEVWPSPIMDCMIPGRSGVIAAADARTARKIAEKQLQPGWMLGAGSHLRAQCQPPHVGRD